MDDQKLEKLQHNLHYEFKDLELLKLALTHRSYAKHNNERFEFLGDAILGFIIAEELSLRFPTAHEGELSRMRAGMVKGDVLAKIALELNLSSALLLGPGELKSGGEKRRSILADAVEAIIAAIYHDAGLQEAKQCILTWYAATLETLSLDDLKKDPKSQLQEWLQARRLPLPDYRLVETRGKDHEQEFIVECSVITLQEPLLGTGSTRRKAEQYAAQQVLEVIKK
ncbi:MAG: ribonuclease III [Gammaproteobacteria bacterium CG11_big_fil_rev_8_21_14_0_20_46_22]|nr:MAG: ribonuclease III [Gammaproteobacteria bacterium CG12_big_fil_rev_8_21_14_0_65_46_12]PIR11692.1 MAG: ribonuclease III [Gammaproteobacteria bacterium CG11_big_fil_rev_8_21_14_0_20_46_22]